MAKYSASAAAPGRTRNRHESIADFGRHEFRPSSGTSSSSNGCELVASRWLERPDISLSAVCIGEGLVLSILEGRGPTRGTLAERETSVAMAVDQELPVAHSGTTRGGKIFTELVLRKKNT